MNTQFKICKGMSTSYVSCIQKKFHFVTVRQQSCGKVMFSVISVCLFVCLSTDTLLNLDVPETCSNPFTTWPKGRYTDGWHSSSYFSIAHSRKFSNICQVGLVVRLVVNMQMLSWSHFQFYSSVNNHKFHGHLKHVSYLANKARMSNYLTLIL